MGRIPLWLLVGIGGFIGTVARWAIGHALPRTPLPLGVLAVNVAGSLLVGFLLFSPRPSPLSPEASAFLAAGVLGGFTTMSAFAYDTNLMAWGRDLPWAAANVVLNVAGSLGAVAAGRGLARLVW